MEQIRIIKEMRDKDAKSGRTGADIRPRFMVWENVPGVFSVNKGRDFAAVLEETIRVTEPEAPDIPVPRNGWTTAGCYMGDGWSVAWRVLDAQYWGVPQRRRRIALVADFGGKSAAEILFKPKSVSGHFEQSKPQRERTSRCAESSTGVYCLQGNGIDRADTAGCNGKGWTENVSYTLNTIDRPAIVFENHSQDSRYKALGEIAQPVTATYGMGGNNQPLVVSIGNGQMDNMSLSEIGNALDCMHDQQAIMISQERNPYIVRRLTPLECERLQGYPDGWTDIGEWVDSKGKKRITSDSARYKALGNSIAIPPWLWVCDQIGQFLGDDKTMASLFSGIGGFELIWSYLYGKENVLFCSEIEEFPIAVTKKRFGEE